MSEREVKYPRTVHCPLCGSTDGFSYDVRQREGGSYSWIQLCRKEDITFVVETTGEKSKA